MQTLKIPARDNYPLSVVLKEHPSNSNGIILLCPGLGIPKEFYLLYLEYLAANGYTVLTWDYRGLGPKANTIDIEVNMLDWATKDIAGILDWVHKQYPIKKIFYFGHSIAGQIAGLIPNYHLIDHFIFFCSTGGHWSLFNFPTNLFIWMFFNMHIPVAVKLFGYLPQGLTYRGVSIAKGIALDWVKWSCNRDYISALFGTKIKNQFYSEISKNIDWIWFEDDIIATDKAITYMMSYYTNAPIKSHKISPKKMGLPKLGHAGFFSKKAGEKLWRYPLDLIEHTDQI